MISSCKVSVDHNNRETVTHGSIEFPVACYHEDVNVENIPWHWHDELEALIVEHGSVYIHVGKDIYEIRAVEGLKEKSFYICLMHPLCRQFERILEKLAEDDKMGGGRLRNRRTWHNHGKHGADIP